MKKTVNRNNQCQVAGHVEQKGYNNEIGKKFYIEISSNWEMWYAEII